ncbi:MAG: exodeoxyribonuclease VII small subunit [SAR202 cluster bacterium]|nr:exodeoxyribonuclease VII small subunit [SAR202 cluster bacterium]
MSPSKNNKTPEPQFSSFEEAFRKLEETAQALEQGSLSLSDATTLYEQGMRLAQVCNDLLTRAELKITQLKNGNSQTFVQPDEEEEA